jgi:flagellar hook capping protein FlgD
MSRFPMKKRTPALVVAGALTIGLLTAAPAQASFLVSEISFGGPVTFYSPYDGPASIRFTFNDATPAQAGQDAQTTFQFRLRLKDAPTSIHTQNVTINPAVDTSPKTFSFSWPALHTSTQKQYEVAVYQGSTLKKERTFTLKPYLVKITSIAPDPFYPTIDDGFKDTTRIEWHLAANSNPVELIIKNGGSEVRHVTWANRVAGNYGYTWNGENGSGQVQPEGNYTVIVKAIDSGQVPGQSQATVTLDRFFTSTRTKTQNGDAFHHRDPTTVLQGGGTCNVRRLTTPHDVRIICRDARVRVFWRWTLTEPDAAIQSQTFTLIAVSGYTCGASFGRTGDTTGSDTWIQVGALGQRRCRVDKARVTYSFTDES